MSRLVAFVDARLTSVDPVASFAKIAMVPPAPTRRTSRPQNDLSTGIQIYSFDDPAQELTVIGQTFAQQADEISMKGQGEVGVLAAHPLQRL